MSNTININGVEITAEFSNGLVKLTFVKDTKVVKVCDSSEASRFVRPENIAKVNALVATTKDSKEAEEYWEAKKVERAAYEAEYQERTGNYEARTAAQIRAMSI